MTALGEEKEKWAGKLANSGCARTGILYLFLTGLYRTSSHLHERQDPCIPTGEAGLSLCKSSVRCHDSARRRQQTPGHLQCLSTARIAQSRDLRSRCGMRTRAHTHHARTRTRTDARTPNAHVYTHTHNHAHTQTHTLRGTHIPGYACRSVKNCCR